MNNKAPIIVVLVATFLMLLVVTVLVLFDMFLTSAGLKVLPESERYHRLSEFKDSVSINSIGEIVNEDYTGDGVWSGAYYSVTIKGSGVFEALAPQVIAAANDETCKIQERSISCTNTNPTVEFNSNGELTTLILSDNLGGRDEK